jgi:ATP-dependent Lhr-like helicase
VVDALAQQLLDALRRRHARGAGAEGIAGGFGAVYDVLKAMEDAGRIRRGYFVAGLGATQFALPGALDLLRSLRDEPENRNRDARRDRSRESVRRHREVADVSRGEKQLNLFLPDDEPLRSLVAREVAHMLATLVKDGTRRALLIAEINDEPASRSPLAPFLVEDGFAATGLGYQLRQAVR